MIAGVRTALVIMVVSTDDGSTKAHARYIK